MKNHVFQVIIYKGENLLCLHVKRDAIELPVSPSVELFRNIGEFGAKNISQTIEQLHTISVILVNSFSRQIAAKGNSLETT